MADLQRAKQHERGIQHWLNNEQKERKAHELTASLELELVFVHGRVLVQALAGHCARGA